MIVYVYAYNGFMRRVSTVTIGSMLEELGTLCIFTTSHVGYRSSSALVESQQIDHLCRCTSP